MTGAAAAEDLRALFAHKYFLSVYSFLGPVPSLFSCFGRSHYKGEIRDLSVAGDLYLHSGERERLPPAFVMSPVLATATAQRRVSVVP